jgi:hypothetical protein
VDLYGSVSGSRLYSPSGRAYHRDFTLAASIICLKQNLSLLSGDPVQVTFETELNSRRCNNKTVTMSEPNQEHRISPGISFLLESNENMFRENNNLSWGG